MAVSLRARAGGHGLGCGCDMRCRASTRRLDLLHYTRSPTTHRCTRPSFNHPSTCIQAPSFNHASTAIQAPTCRRSHTHVANTRRGKQQAASSKQVSSKQASSKLQAASEQAARCDATRRLRKYAHPTTRGEAWATRIDTRNKGTRHDGENGMGIWGCAAEGCRRQHAGGGDAGANMRAEAMPSDAPGKTEAQEARQDAVEGERARDAAGQGGVWVDTCGWEARQWGGLPAASAAPPPTARPP